MKWGESVDGKIEYSTMTMEDAQLGLEAIRSGFFPDESVSIACEVSSNPAACRELEELCIDAAKDGVSVIAKEKETNTVAGVLYNKIQVKTKPGEQNYFEKFRDTRCVEKNSIGLMNLMIHVDSQVDAFARYDADCSLELMFLATKPEFRKRGIGKDLVKYSLALGRSLAQTKLSQIPQISNIICTHIGSTKICQSLRFDELHKVKWSEVTYNGVTYDKKVDYKIHECLSLMVKRLK